MAILTALIAYQCYQKIQEFDIDIEDSRLLEGENFHWFINVWLRLFEEYKRDQEVKIEPSASAVFYRIERAKKDSVSILDIKDGDTDPESQWFEEVVAEILVPATLNWAGINTKTKKKIIPIGKKAKIIPLIT